MPVADGLPASPAQSGGCALQWMRQAGLWSAADDHEILVRYGPQALSDQWYCCKVQPWRS